MSKPNSRPTASTVANGENTDSFSSCRVFSSADSAVVSSAPASDSSGTTFFGVRITGHSAVSLPCPSAMWLTGTPKKPARPKVW